MCSSLFSMLDSVLVIVSSYEIASWIISHKATKEKVQAVLE